MKVIEDPASLKLPAILESHGEAPEQYGGIDDDEDFEDEDDFEED